MQSFAGEQREMTMKLSLKLALLIAASALSACVQTPNVNPGGPVIVDDECPRADDQPCR